MYRTTTTTLIGDVLIRFSKSGDFELTFSKGPGVTLLSLRQDATFAEVNGHSRKAVGLAQSIKRPSRCAAGSACATDSFTRRINRFDTPPVTKLFSSAFD
jgi:hypothetical protein